MGHRAAVGGGGRFKGDLVKHVLQFSHLLSPDTLSNLRIQKGRPERDGLIWRDRESDQRE